MPQAQRTDEELNKSIDALIEDVFAEEETPSEDVEKSAYIAGDSKTTADAVMSSVPKGQSDESRNAGRPKQISDVPQNDMDGRREGEYDGSISENKKEDEPEETKKQIKVMDQSIDKNRISSASPAPKGAPFKKSEGGESTEVKKDEVTLSKSEYEEFQAFKKAQEQKKADEAQAEELKKAQVAKKEQEDLIKSAVSAATADLRKSYDDLKKVNEEQSTILKALANQPVRPKSVTGIDQLEKSQSPEDKGPQTFSKSEILDAATELVMKGKLSDVVVSEIEMTNRVSDPQARKMIEQYLEGK